MQTGFQGFLVKIIKRLTRKKFQGFSSLLPNNSIVVEIYGSGDSITIWNTLSNGLRVTGRQQYLHHNR
jgi:hypothetical protein